MVEDTKNLDAKHREDAASEVRKLAQACEIFGIDITSDVSEEKSHLDPLTRQKNVALRKLNALQNPGGETEPLNPTDEEEIIRLLEAAKLKDQGEFDIYREDYEPEFVEELLDAMMEGTTLYQSGSLHENKKEYPFLTHVSFQTWGSKVKLPRSIAGERWKISKPFWSYIAEKLFAEAAEKIINKDKEATIEYLMAQTRGTISDMTEFGDSFRFYYDARAEREDTYEDVNAVFKAYKKVLRAALREVMKDKAYMRDLYEAASNFTNIETEIVMRDRISKIDRIRNQNETEDDRKIFLSFCRQAVKHLPGCEDIEIGMLSSKDSYMLGCSGLHRPKSIVFPKGKIEVSMTSHYDGTIRDWDYVMQILAHEGAHARIREEYGDSIYPGTQVHSQIHEIYTYENLVILRKLRKWETVEDDNGNVIDIKPVFTENYQPQGEPMLIEIIGNKNPVQLARKALEIALTAQKIANDTEFALGIVESVAEKSSELAETAALAAKSAENIAVTAGEHVTSVQRSVESAQERLTRYMETGEATLALTPNQQMVKVNLENWRIIVQATGISEYSKTKQPKIAQRKIVQLIRTIQETVNRTPQEFSAEFIRGLKKFTRLVTERGATIWSGYTECTEQELNDNIKALLMQLKPVQA